MFTNRYEYNPDTLTYVKVELTTKQRLTRISLSLLGLCTFIFLIAFLIFSYFFDTIGYESMRLEKKQLVAQIKSFNKRLDQVNKVIDDLQVRDENIYRVVFEADPIPTSIREAGIGGTDKYEKLRGFENSDLIIKTNQRLDNISSKLNIQSSSFDELYGIAKTKVVELQSIPALMPVSPEKTYITSWFGYRFHPLLRRNKMHEGIDYAGPIGTKIYATGDGVVESASMGAGYGRLVVVDHGFGYKTKYAHLKKYYVKKGQKVKRGDVIAELGSSGVSTGPHLHYEVLKNGVHMNPIHYYFNDLSPEEYNGMLTLEKSDVEELN